MASKKGSIHKATGIPPHVILLANKRKVILSQHVCVCVLNKHNAINKEFDKREVGPSSYLIQTQVQEFLSTFKSKISSKIDSLGSPHRAEEDDPGGATKFISSNPFDRK
jgi:hypothetical protein